ncbi:hypothetical protein MNBD_GAMMA07-129 [hydrothermal vent metagenome]|uniref:Thioredoxin-like fold domain-containing protein n=1 Tax=hydrothermal vent metagenome TaxID=652676 RepID=A0A3B0X1G4_9ZZZZ
MSIKVEIFSSSGCNKCQHAKNLLRKLAIELGGDTIEWCEINVLDAIDYAVELGVLSTPSIAINGKLVFTQLPSSKKLHQELLSQLNKHKAKSATTSGTKK